MKNIFKGKEVNWYAFGMTIATLIFQAIHGFFVFESISQYEGFWPAVQALGLALIIVGGVFFFSIFEPPKTKDDNGKEIPLRKRILSMCFYLMAVEIVVNFYYHGLKIFSSDGGFQWSDAAIIPVAVALDITIPYLVYRYSTHIIKEPEAKYGYKPNGEPRKYPYKRRK